MDEFLQVVMNATRGLIIDNLPSQIFDESPFFT
jgi:hypothetical protein